MVDMEALAHYWAKPNKTIAEHTQELLNNLKILEELGYVSDKRVYKLTEEACQIHDSGKMNSIFQERVQKHKKFDASKEVGHNLLSFYMIDPNRYNKSDYLVIAYAVLNHHHYVDNAKAITENQDLIKKLLQDILDSLGVQISAQTLVAKWGVRQRNKLNEIKEKPITILVKGLLHKCDYAASAGIPAEYPNDFLMQGLDQLLGKWQKNNPDAGWNNLQSFCQAHQQDNLLITAPTGMGKTEAGLLWLGNNKGFFVLPLKTAINAMYERIKKDILNSDVVDKRLALLHSDTLSIYQRDKVDEEYDVLAYYNRSKKLSMPLNISTPDQLFDFVFKAPGYELKLATLAYSKIIIDEIQAYSPDLLAFLIYGLQSIDELGGKFAILTATFPPFIKDLIKLSGKNSPVEKPIHIIDQSFSPNIIRHNLKIKKTELTTEDVIQIHQKNIAAGKSSKCLVVCNTIKKAQEIYQELEDNKIPNIYLLHSKFIKKDRSIKEDAILTTGKTFLEDQKTINARQEIWVSTQIVEASLDIDFDYLFTELSELNGLFQRLGRCNRKGEKAVDEPNCYVYTEIDPNIIINGSRGFIDKRIYELSKEGICVHGDGILTEDEKQDIIKNYLTTDKLKKSDYIEDYWLHYDFVKNLYLNEVTQFDVQRRFRNIISYTVIPHDILLDPDNKNKIEDILERLTKIKKTLRSDKILPDQRKMYKIESIELKDELMQYTVPVGYFDIYYDTKNKSNNDIVNSYRLSEDEEIFIIDGHYNSKLGFQRLSAVERKAKKCQSKTEEFFDSFI
ncbi:MAG: CRISPR-associated helicase Cas3' [Bacillota bacterium]